MFISIHVVLIKDDIVEDMRNVLLLELAFLLYTTVGNKLSCTEIEQQFTEVFGKKLSVLAEHHTCDIPELIKRYTPLKVCLSTAASIPSSIHPSLHCFYLFPGD